MGALCKVLFSLVGCECLSNCCSPKLEMFFAPTTVVDLTKRWGTAKLGAMADEAMGAFVDEAMSKQWIKVTRSDSSIEAVQAAYKRVFRGGDEVPPSEAVVVSLAALCKTGA